MVLIRPKDKEILNRGDADLPAGRQERKAGAEVKDNLGYLKRVKANYYLKGKPD